MIIFYTYKNHKNCSKLLIISLKGIVIKRKIAQRVPESVPPTWQTKIKLAEREREPGSMANKVEVFSESLMNQTLATPMWPCHPVGW